jgi:hypothetical protein
MQWSFAWAVRFKYGAVKYETIDIEGGCDAGCGMADDQYGSRRDWKNCDDE